MHRCRNKIRISLHRRSGFYCIARNTMRQHVLFCIEQAYQTVDEAVRKKFPQHHEELILQSSRVLRLERPLLREAIERPRNEGGLHAVLLVMLHRGDGAGECRVSIHAGKALFPCGSEAGFDVSRHEGGHTDAIRAYFVGEGCAERVDGSLCRGIEALKRNREHGRDRAYAEDAAAFLRAHLGKHGLYAVKRAEEVHIKLPLGVRRLGELHRAGNAEAGVAYEHIDPPFAFCDCGDRLPDALRVGHVRGDMNHRAAFIRLAGKAVNGIPFFGKQRCRGKADAAGSTCDDGDFILHPASTPFRRYQVPHQEVARSAWPCSLCAAGTPWRAWRAAARDLHKRLHHKAAWKS